MAFLCCFHFLIIHLPLEATGHVIHHHVWGHQVGCLHFRLSPVSLCLPKAPTVLFHGRDFSYAFLYSRTYNDSLLPPESERNFQEPSYILHSTYSFGAVFTCFQLPYLLLCPARIQGLDAKHLESRGQLFHGFEMIQYYIQAKSYQDTLR